LKIIMVGNDEGKRNVREGGVSSRTCAEGKGGKKFRGIGAFMRVEGKMIIFIATANIELFRD